MFLNKSVSKAEIIDTIRRGLVGAAKIGQRLVLDCGQGLTDFKADLGDEPSSFPVDTVFNVKEWRKPENYKKILRGDEDKDNFGNKGHYSMNQDF